MRPVRPTLDGEPSYEGIPKGLHDISQPYWEAHEVRRYAYWSVFAGAAGFTYGHNAVMQFHRPIDEKPAFGAREYWDAALDAPGAGQMEHLKALMQSRPGYLHRVPDQDLIGGINGQRHDYLAATRGPGYVFIYNYTGRFMPVRMGVLPGDEVKASWYNPRNGQYAEAGTVPNIGIRVFDPPGVKEPGNDWVLVLDVP